MPVIATTEIAFSYINMTLEMNGVPGLFWRDWDTEMGLTFWLKSDQIDRVMNNLRDLGCIHDQKMAQTLFSVGFYFDVSKGSLGYRNAAF